MSSEMIEKKRTNVMDEKSSICFEVGVYSLYSTVLRKMIKHTETFSTKCRLCSDYKLCGEKLTDLIIIGRIKLKFSQRYFCSSLV